jgi:crotonobetainyl-CoA:carnitine CoA-transferase CaiB-like acyl-CoA transferase
LSNPVGRGPGLSGVRVISLGAFIAGNAAAQILSDLGADVIKIEMFARPEVLRRPVFTFGPPATEPSGVPNTVMFATLTRGLRNVAIDIREPAGRSIFLDLVGQADLLIENFAGPTLERWGYAFDQLTAVNPRLVVLSLSGYGHDGPRGNYLAYASSISNYTGLSAAWGFTHIQHSDYITGVTGALAAVGALLAARQDGRPIRVDAAQLDAIAPTLAPLLVGPLNDRPSEWTANRPPGSVHAGVYETLGHDCWLAVELEDITDWDIACAFLERPELSRTEGSRNAVISDADRDQLDAAFAQWAAEITAHSGQQVLQQHGLAAGAVQSSEDIWRDPQLRERQFPVRLGQPDLGLVTYPGPPQRWYPPIGVPPGQPARLGEHTLAVLSEWLGDDAAERAQGISGQTIFDAQEEKT